MPQRQGSALTRQKSRLGAPNAKAAAVAAASSATPQMQKPKRVTEWKATEELTATGFQAIQSPEAVPNMMEARTEALQWWYNQGFDSAVPTRILSAALRKQLVDFDPWVAEMMPRTLVRIYGSYMDCDTFMNRFLLQFGGYTSGNNVEVPRGQGLPLLSNLGRVAESLLAFLQHWDASIEAADQEEMQRNAGAKNVKKQSLKPCGCIQRG